MAVTLDDEDARRDVAPRGAPTAQARGLHRRDIDGGARDRLAEDVAGLPEQLEAAWTAAFDAELPPAFVRPARVVVLGVGGSWTVSNLLRALAIDLGAPTPVLVVRGHALPTIVDRRSLVLACSISGDADETVPALREAIDDGIPCGVVSPAGELVELAREHRIPAFVYARGGDRGASPGGSLGTLLALCARAGVLSRSARDLPRALDALRIMRARVEPAVPEATNEAKQLARRLAGKCSLIAGAQALAPVAHRWRTQIAEKTAGGALSDELTELHHHTNDGFAVPADARPFLHGVFLRHASMNELLRLRMDETAMELRVRGASVETVDIAGPSVLAQLLSALQLGDFVSHYVAALNGVQPSTGYAIGPTASRCTSHEKEKIHA